jgi:hypothetical protein
MHRIYLTDGSFYDTKLSDEMDLEYLTRFLCEGASFIFIDATCGHVCLSKSAIVKIIKL